MVHLYAHMGDHFQLILNWYRRNSSVLVGEEVITGLHINALMQILGNPIWNHIYHCWEIESKHMEAMQPYTDHHFQPDKYIYFIEAYNSS